ncbi:hypothetical protein B0H14DRAFT_3896989 [Mycena olivaceomarginata]|nr:hypothetical protein B0H14DRAFT_3896989 [Mycena olivaceomarginata]
MTTPACTSTLEPPCRAHAPKSRAARVSPTPSASASTSGAAQSTLSPASAKPLTAADLRLTALIERSIASTLSRYADDPDSSRSDLEQQDLLLCERLQSLLALHGCHLRMSSPTRMSTGILPPAYAPSVPLSGREGVDPPAIDASAVRSPALHCHRRAREHRCGSGDVRTGSNTVPIPAEGQGADGRGDEEDVGAAGVEAHPGELAPAPWLLPLTQAPPPAQITPAPIELARACVVFFVLHFPFFLPSLPYPLLPLLFSPLPHASAVCLPAPPSPPYPAFLPFSPSLPFPSTPSIACTRIPIPALPSFPSSPFLLPLPSLPLSPPSSSSLPSPPHVHADLPTSPAFCLPCSTVFFTTTSDIGTTFLPSGTDRRLPF